MPPALHAGFQQHDTRHRTRLEAKGAAFSPALLSIALGCSPLPFARPQMLLSKGRKFLSKKKRKKGHRAGCDQHYPRFMLGRLFLITF